MRFIDFSALHLLLQEAFFLDNYFYLLLSCIWDVDFIIGIIYSLVKK